jgi:UDP-N-acetylmuramoyl-L-alanyl-D-glutamate--2,6-diaminopimelate ligase
MLLEQLVNEIPILASHGNLQTAVAALTCDSRQVTAGTLFFALPGAKADGHGYIQQAVSAGAAAVVLEDATCAPEQTPWIQVKSGRQVMALMAARFYGQPTNHLPLIGITGTNGKTTTSYLIEGILDAAKLSAAVLGTISYRFGNTCIEASHTTPESTELQGIFRQLADAGAKAFVMEVSSHALEQHRVDGSAFNVGVFTNLTRDHLDYHGSMEAYRDAKLRLFSELLKPDNSKPVRRAVINADDPAAQEFIQAATCPVIRYGITTRHCEVTARELSSSVDGISGLLVMPDGCLPFHSRLVGSYNLSNILAAAATGVALEITPEVIVAGIEQQKSVPGRLERVDNNAGVTCLVDYAHTGDALENVLGTLKKLATSRIITVFGCGGDRDNGKRPIMGKIAADYSDLAIVTSDNPRTENPAVILNQIREGIIPLAVHEYTTDALGSDFSDKGFVVVENRREAIRLAVSLAQPGDILLLAGKGHEDYQIIGTTKHHFDDREEAISAFREQT